MIRRIKGVIKKRYQVASGLSESSPYPDGTIRMQTPFFLERGLDIREYYPGTLNVSISPLQFRMLRSSYTFEQVPWRPPGQPESFSFLHCSIITPNQATRGLVYYPHPGTKTRHFHEPSTLELLAPRIEGVAYEDELFVEVEEGTLEVSLGPED